MFTVPYVTPYWRLRLMKLHGTGRRRLNAKTPLSISAAVCWPWSPNDWEQRQRGARTPPQSMRTQTVDTLYYFYFFTRFTVVLAGDPYHARVPSAHPRESEDAAGRESAPSPVGRAPERRAPPTSRNSFSARSVLSAHAGCSPWCGFCRLVCCRGTSCDSNTRHECLL